METRLFFCLVVVIFTLLIVIIYYIYKKKKKLLKKKKKRFKEFFTNFSHLQYCFEVGLSCQGLIWKIRAASNIGQKGHLKKKDTKNFTTLYLISFLSVLHQNKA